MTNKTWKRILCLLICVAMIFVVLPQGITISAESYSGICGDNLTWLLNRDTGLLTITGTGKMNEYLYDYNIPWYSYRSYIKTVEIENGVISIDNYAFYNYSSVESAIIPDSLTEIGYESFTGCTIKNLIVAEGSKTINSLMISMCSESLESLTIPKTVIQIDGGIFSNCKVLSSITVNEENKVYYSAGNCIISSKDGELIAGCSDSIIPTDGSVVSLGRSAFCSCTGLTSITIPDSVTSIGFYAFAGCSSLESVIIGNNVTSIGWEAFKGCSSLKSVIIGNNVKTIGLYAFDGCSSLSNVTVGNSVVEIGCYAFRGCTELNNIIMPKSVTHISSSAFEGCTGLTRITIPYSVTLIEGEAFYGCNRLTDVYYTGSEKKQESIYVGEGNNALIYSPEWHYRYSPQCEHSETEVVNAKSPTCALDGYTGDTECSYCGSLISEGTIIPAFGHDYTAVVTNPTCTKQGYTTYTCSRCRDIYVGDYTEAIGHSPGVPVKRNIVAATCTSGGTYDEVVYCTVCGVELSRTKKTTDSIGHDYTGIITNPTCAKGGFITYICSRCGDSYVSDFTPALGHNYEAETTDPTCTEQGYTTYTCSNCGQSYITDSEPTGHTPSDWIIDREAQIGVAGSKHKECTICGMVLETEEIPAESPIARIEIADMEITEYTHGYYSDNDNYIYNQLLNGLTIVMNDGSRIESNNEWVEINGSSYSLNIDSSDQYNEQWSAGNTYEVTASLLGESCTFNVTIKESPIASIQMDDIEVIEYTNGNWKNDRYINNWLQFSGKAIMKDGSECILKFDGSGSDYDDGRAYRGFEVDGEKYSMFIDLSSQYEETWTAGHKYQINCQALGLNDTFNITVTENPIVSVAIDDLTLIQGIDSWNTGTYDYYNIYPTYTVTFKDGTQKTVENGNSVYVGKDSYSYSNLSIDVDQWQSPFEPGKTYELTGRIGPASNTFTLTIVENPVNWIEVLKNPDKTDYYVYEVPDMKGLKLRIHYKDGEYEDFLVDSSCVASKCYSVFSEKLQRSDEVMSWDTYCAGEIALTKELFGKEFEIPITVSEIPAVDLSVREDESKSLVLTVTKNDGTSEDWKIIAISGLDISSDDYITAHQINTDHGFFDMDLYQDENGYVIILNNSDNQVIESNVLEKSEWLEVASLLPGSIAEKGYDWLIDSKNEHYLGNLTTGNIDDTIRFLFESCPTSYWEYAIDSGESVDKDGNYEAYYIYTGDYLRQVLLKYLALDEIDLSLSNNYDSQTDTYRLVCSLGGGEFTLSRLEYKNGIWTAEYNICWWDGPLTTYYCLNDEHKVIKIDNKDTLYGDLNGDGKINGKDGILCSQALAGWDVVYSELAADVNGDGKFNGKDGILLSQYLAGWDVVLG